MKYLYLLSIFIFISTNLIDKELTAQEIIDKSITVSGANKVSNSQIFFNFRDKKYWAIRKNGEFKLARQFKQKSEIISQIVSNDGFNELINGQPLNSIDSLISNYTNSINSVHYFSVLPYGLNDGAVHKKLLPSSTIKGKEYYKIEITFSKDGGGEDFEDVFIYWVGKKDFLIDYLAYSYHTNGGGKRFRVLKEQCNVKGIRFVDYHNYKPLNKKVSLINIDKAFENNQLKKVSEIILKDIEVTILD